MSAQPETNEMCVTINRVDLSPITSSIGFNHPVRSWESESEFRINDHHSNVISSTDLNFSDFVLPPNTWYDDTDIMMKEEMFEIVNEMFNDGFSDLDPTKSADLKRPANVVNQNSFNSFQNEKMAVYKNQNDFMQYKPTNIPHFPEFSTKNVSHHNQFTLPPTHHEQQQNPSGRCYWQQSYKAVEGLYAYLKNFQNPLWQQHQLNLQYLKKIQLQQEKQRLLKQQQQQTVLITSKTKTPQSEGPPNVAIQRKPVGLQTYEFEVHCILCPTVGNPVPSQM